MKDQIEPKIAAALALLDSAVKQYHPKMVVGLMSGGDDSIPACYVASLHPRFSGILHVNTGIGIEATREHVRKVCAKTLPKMRELMGWVPFRGFYISNKLADFQHDALIDRIKAANAEEDSADGLHNHRCSMDHPPCPACELLEEREHEREAGL